MVKQNYLIKSRACLTYIHRTMNLYGLVYDWHMSKLLNDIELNMTYHI